MGNALTTWPRCSRQREDASGMAPQSDGRRRAQTPSQGWLSLLPPEVRVRTEGRAVGKDLMALGGWRDPKTVIQCYQQADLGRVCQALANRNPLTESTHPELGLVGLAS